MFWKSNFQHFLIKKKLGKHTNTFKRLLQNLELNNKIDFINNEAIMKQF